MKSHTPMKAFRAKCLDCSGGSWLEVKHCPVNYCPLWPYRFGKRPKSGSEEERVHEEMGLMTIGELADPRVASAAIADKVAPMCGGGGGLTKPEFKSLIGWACFLDGVVPGKYSQPAELEAMASEEQTAGYVRFTKAERTRSEEAKSRIKKMDAEGKEVTDWERFGEHVAAPGC